MPPAIYAFSFCAFALGLTEFVVIGLLPAMSADLNAPTAQVGEAVTAYAIGVAVGAPILTALTVGWPRRALLLSLMLLFVVGNLAVALSPTLMPLLGARFASGLAHGVFLAVASSIAAGIVGPQRAGGAVAFVFGGLTVALVLGVPLGTFLGSVWDWRAVFVFVSLCAAAGLAGIVFTMPKAGTNARSGSGDVRSSLAALANVRLLAAASLSVLAYSGTFASFTYISPLLSEVTGLGVGSVSLLLLGYGAAATVGNVVGGRLTDRLGPDAASAGILATLSAVLFGIWVLASVPAAMIVLVTLLGAATFAAVPALQARIMAAAAAEARDVSAVAAGLNIAGFNVGIALGSFAGARVVTMVGYPATAIVGAVVVALALPIVLRGQRGVRPHAAG